MIEIIMVLAMVFVGIFIITFFYLSKDIFKTGVVKVKKEKIKHKEPFYILLIAWILTLAILAGEFVQIKPQLSIITYIGAAIVLLGGILRVAAKKQLHRFYSFYVIIQKDHKIIKKGPYAKIRHPLIAGHLLMVIGILIMAQSIYGSMLFIIALFPASVFYTSQEETLKLTRTKPQHEL